MSSARGQACNHHSNAKDLLQTMRHRRSSHLRALMGAVSLQAPPAVLAISRLAVTQPCQRPSLALQSCQVEDLHCTPGRHASRVPSCSRKAAPTRRSASSAIYVSLVSASGARRSVGFRNVTPGSRLRMALSELNTWTNLACAEVFRCSFA